MRKERGDKIFACHLASCTRLFSNPKGRRLHLISAHGYPKEYFFAVTNKGVGGLLKKWGEGASMIRGKWKPREPPQANTHMPVDKEAFREKMDVDEDSDEDNDDDDEEDSSGDEDDYTATRNPAIHVSNTSTSKSNRMAIDQDPEATPRPPVLSSLPPAATPPTTAKPLQPSTTAADILASGFSALSLVPPSVRFGRGGRGGFVGHGGHQKRPSQSNVVTTEQTAVVVPAGAAQPAEQDAGAVDIKSSSAGRGRGGGSNRARGGSVPGGAVEGTGRGGGGGRGRGGRGRGRGGRGY
ncbi:hypothetical protein MD484_g1799, partial [Candolleomyces efflorescens]